MTQSCASPLRVSLLLCVPQSQESARSRWASLSPEEKLSLLEVSYEEEKEKARKAKEEGRMGRRDKLESEAILKDIREQITELKVIVGKRKKELKKLQVGGQLGQRVGGGERGLGLSEM